MQQKPHRELQRSCTKALLSLQLRGGQISMKGAMTCPFPQLAWLPSGCNPKSSLLVEQRVFRMHYRRVLDIMQSLRLAQSPLQRHC